MTTTPDEVVFRPTRCKVFSGVLKTGEPKMPIAIYEFHTKEDASAFFDGPVLDQKVYCEFEFMDGE